MWKILLLIFVIIIAVGLYLTFRTHNPQIWSSNLEKDTLENSDWRHVLTTSPHLQVVAMSTPPGASLGWEVHRQNDQFFRVESGTANLSTKDANGVSTITLRSGDAALVPAGTEHNLYNTGTSPLKMYTVYGPAHHAPGTIDHTHADELKREMN